MMLSEIGTYLGAQGVASTSGANGWLLIKGLLPDSSALPDKLVGLIQTPGLPPDGGRTEIDRPGLQVQVRGASTREDNDAYVDAHTEAEAIRTTLHGITPQSLSGRAYVGIWALQDPFLIRMDENDRPIIGCNYRIQRSRT